MTEETTHTKLNPALETDLAQAFTHAMTHEDIESIANLFAPDGEWVIMATGETFRGLDQITHTDSDTLGRVSDQWLMSHWEQMDRQACAALSDHTVAAMRNALAQDTSRAFFSQSSRPS